MAKRVPGPPQSRGSWCHWGVSGEESDEMGEGHVAETIPDVSLDLTFPSLSEEKGADLQRVFQGKGC